LEGWEEGGGCRRRGGFERRSWEEKERGLVLVGLERVG
jgi:hypothetical protein